MLAVHVLDFPVTVWRRALGWHTVLVRAMLTRLGGIGVPVLHCVPVGYVMPNPTLAGALYVCVRKNL